MLHGTVFIERILILVYGFYDAMHIIQLINISTYNSSSDVASNLIHLKGLNILMNPFLVLFQTFGNETLGYKLYNAYLVILIHIHCIHDATISV